MRLVAGDAADKSKVPSQPENTAMNQSNRVSSSLRVAGLGTALALAVVVMPAVAAEQSTQPQDQAPAATGTLTKAGSAYCSRSMKPWRITSISLAR